MNFIFPYIGKNHPNWLSYFSEGLKPPISMFLDPNFTLHSDLTSSQDLFRRRPIIFVHDLHKYSPIISPDAPWCYIVYLPTKLAPLWGKCWYIFHTWSIWDPISSYAQVAIWSAAWTAARTTLNGAVLGWVWGVIKSNGFGVPQNHPKTSLRPHCDLTGTMVNKSIREIMPKWPWFRLVKYYKLPRKLSETQRKTHINQMSNEDLPLPP